MFNGNPCQRSVCQLIEFDKRNSPGTGTFKYVAIYNYMSEGPILCGRLESNVGAIGETPRTNSYFAALCNVTGVSELSAVVVISSNEEETALERPAVRKAMKRAKLVAAESGKVTSESGSAAKSYLIRSRKGLFHVPKVLSLPGRYE